MYKRSNPPAPIVAMSVATAIATIAVYWQVGRFEYVSFDDYTYVLKNYHITPGITWPGVQWAFRTNGARFWMPLSWISYMADCQLFGLNAGAQHLTNVAIHLLASGALFLFLLCATGRQGCSAFVAALFALHPLHVESVAWIAERKDVLCAAFWFLTLWTWVRYARSGRWSWYGAALLLCVAGMLSKPMMVTMPAVLLIVDFWPLARPFRPTLLYEKIPFGLIGVAGSAMAVASQKYVYFGRIPLGLRVENALNTIWIYIFRTLWPLHLGIMYPFPAAIPLWQPVLSGTALALVSAIAIRLRHSAPWFAAGWLWYLITLLPVLGLVQSGAQASVDHYLYIPLVGLFIVVAWGGAAASSQWPRARRMALVTAAGICLFHAVIARQLVGSWRTTETLFDRALYVNPANYIVWTMLGTLDEEKGRMADAHAAFETSIQLRPDYLPAYEALADWYKGQKQPAEALQLRESAVQLDQDSAQAWESLGVALYEAGRFDEAWDKLLKAASLLPGDPHTHAMMGSTLIAKGSVLAGLDEYDQAVARDPFDGLNRRLIGRFWQSTGPRGIEQVVDAFRHAVAADPLDAVNHASLGNALAETPDGREEAIRELRVAQKLHWDAGVDASLQRLNAGSPAK